MSTSFSAPDLGAERREHRVARHGERERQRPAAVLAARVVELDAAQRRVGRVRERGRRLGDVVRQRGRRGDDLERRAGRLEARERDPGEGEDLARLRLDRDDAAEPVAERRGRGALDRDRDRRAHGRGPCAAWCGPGPCVPASSVPPGCPISWRSKIRSRPLVPTVASPGCRAPRRRPARRPGSAPSCRGSAPTRRGPWTARFGPLGEDRPVTGQDRRARRHVDDGVQMLVRCEPREREVGRPGDPLAAAGVGHRQRDRPAHRPEDAGAVGDRDQERARPSGAACRRGPPVAVAVAIAVW